MSRVEEQLAAARQSLLDLTLRNPLLNHRERSARTIRVVEEAPRDIYEQLVLRERRLRFLPGRGVSGGAAAEGPMDAAAAGPVGTTPEGTAGAAGPGTAIAEAPESGARSQGEVNAHDHRFLHTDLPAADLERRLLHVHQQARLVLQEQGYTILYLALGFVHWADGGPAAGGGEAARGGCAPLILVPVELSRPRVGRAFSLSWTGEDVQTNVSLREKLAEPGVVLPDFDMPEDSAGIEAYFAAVGEAIAGRAGWRLTAEVLLDFFSFTKFAMFKDLDPAAWPAGRSPAEHPLVRHLLDPAGAAPPSDAAQEDAALQDAAPDSFCVLDADPSQRAVIEDVKAGRDLVVEGPPGTGKSQTITNLIAELLAAGQRVLFVSEKMAALQVVKGRLDALGLGDACIELHSRKVRKKDVLEELQRTLLCQAPKDVDVDERFEDLQRIAGELNDYARAFGAPLDGLQRCPHELLERAEAHARYFQGLGRPRPRVEIKGPLECAAPHWRAALDAVQELAEALRLVRPLQDNPWLGSDPRATLPAHEDDIAALVVEFAESVQRLARSFDVLAERAGIRLPACPEEIKPALTAAAHVGIAPRVPERLLHGVLWDEHRTLRGTLIETLTALTEVHAQLGERLTDAALQVDAAPLLDDYAAKSGGWLRLFSARYRRLKREVAGLYRGTAPRSTDMRLRDLALLVRWQDLRARILSADEQGRALFSGEWCGPHTDPAALRTYADWVEGFRQRTSEGLIQAAAAPRVEAGIDGRAVDEAVQEAGAAAQEFFARCEALSRRIHLRYGVAFGCDVRRVPFEVLASRLERMAAGVSGLHVWSQFVARCSACAQTVAAPVIGLIEHQDVEPEDLVPAFEAALIDAVLGQAFEQRPVLGQFVGALHESKRQRFAALDEQLIGLNRQRLARRLFERRPQLQAGAPAGSEAGILQGEFNRKRGHLPIRKLLSRAGGLIQRIKPCFMMSPLSIAQFLDPTTVNFDVIVFDEASQVRPADALGALLRGTQVVVMGDTRQLPPTSFFDHLIEAEALEDDTASVAEVESILHQCKRAMPSRHLRWHYRSRHESLIAVSNQEFYDNRLFIYPSATADHPFLGLHFCHVPGTVYDRGRSGMNRQEAKAVVAAALEHYRSHPQHSLGIGAFNVRQQQAILEEVELQLRQHPELEQFFDGERPECFFVKNLETIQGDERDVIFISVGFGFDEARLLSRNFGPVNQEGGERRLNVLITRARRRCVVFANFKPEDLEAGPLAPFGLRSLKVFLEYAAHRRLQTWVPTGGDCESPLEESVHDFLHGRGFEVRKQVGCASYRIDLAVVDPQHPGRYLLGIECDGARYHSTPTARERDRLRQQVLERLGWQLHRVWSTDWYRSRSSCQEALLQRIAHCRDAGVVPEECAAQTSGDASGVHAARLEQPDVEYEQHTEPDGDDGAGAAVAYALCGRPPSVRTAAPLHELPPNELAAAVAEIVRVEGPVHQDEVSRRLRGWWSLGRVGARAREAVERAIDVATARAALRRDDAGFLWPLPARPVPVRRRDGDPPARVELICDEEIAAAVRQVLQAHHATVPEALARQTARLLGIRAVSQNSAERIAGVIERLIASGTCARQANGMVALATGSS